MLNTTMEAIMSPDVISVSPDTPLSECLALMATRHISCLPVVEEGKPVGIFTERDLIARYNRLVDNPGIPISEAMTTPVVTARKSSTIEEAYRLGFAKKIRHMIIVDDTGRLIGVVCQSDMAKGLSRNVLNHAQDAPGA